MISESSVVKSTGSKKNIKSSGNNSKQNANINIRKIINGSTSNQRNSKTAISYCSVDSEGKL
ncbi:SICA antigen [Chryseobacterium sp. StRB126]|nr:SICA antigen [Chryseobacterium sp. StRB126]